jgi:hypothetical protein
MFIVTEKYKFTAGTVEPTANSTAVTEQRRSHISYLFYIFPSLMKNKSDLSRLKSAKFEHGVGSVGQPKTKTTLN